MNKKAALITFGIFFGCFLFTVLVTVLPVVAASLIFACMFGVLVYLTYQFVAIEIGRKK